MAELYTSHKFGKALNLRCNWLLLIICFMGLVLCCVFSDQSVSGYLACGFLVAFFVAIVYEKPTFLIKYPFALFAVSGSMAGVCSIEFLPSFYLGELRRYTYFAGALPLLALGWWVYLAVLYLSISLDKDDCCYKMHFSTKALKWLPYLTFGVLAICLVLFFSVLPHPSFLYGMDRFEYSSQYLSGPLRTISNCMAFLIVIPIFSIREGHKRSGICAVAIYFLFLFWTGSKFGEFYNVVCLFFLVYFDTLKTLGVAILRKICLIVVAMLLVAVFFAGFAYGLTSTVSMDQFFSARTAQQGQLWWSIYDSTAETTHIDEFVKNELPALTESKAISDCVGSRNGIYLAMYLSAPTSVIDVKLAGGSRYSEAGFACAYYYFGAPGVVLFAVFCALLIVAFTNGFLNTLRYGEFLGSLIQARFIFNARVALSMFLFSQFLTALSLICFGYLFIRRIMRKNLQPENINQVSDFKGHIGVVLR